MTSSAGFSLRRLLPHCFALLLGYAAVGVPLPVLSLYLHDQLRMGPLVVGAMIGLQYLTTLLTRRAAGHLCDRRGAKTATMIGLVAAAGAVAIYLASAPISDNRLGALGLLALGRVAMGIGDSLFVTGLAAWMVAEAGPAHAGRAMAWNGIALYAALAAGAPIGTALYRLGGFGTVALATILLPLLGLAVAAGLRPADPAHGTQRGSMLQVVRAIWAPGLSLALASSGVGTLAAFLTLRYRSTGWPGAGFALTAFGAAYILMRLIFAGLPDRLGGRRVGACSLAAEAAGQVLLWAAQSPAAAFAGAALTGFGYSLVFPSCGVEALRRVGNARGLAIGLFLACFDLGLGLAGPLAGLVSSQFGLDSVFLVAAASAVVAIPVLLLG